MLTTWGGRVGCNLRGEAEQAALFFFLQARLVDSPPEQCFVRFDRINWTAHSS